MARVVGVHGIGKQLLGEDTLLSQWFPAVCDGLRRAGASYVLTESDMVMAFYGHLFRSAGEFLAVDDPRFTADDVEDGFERDLLLSWWRAASEIDPGVVPPDADTLVGTPQSVQAALRALAGSRFFAGIAIRSMVFDLKQVRRYLLDSDVRVRARARVLDTIREDTRVVVAHSLGSVVAYEALCALPGHQVRALVTLGSPLGIRNLVFDRLNPQPKPTGLGQPARGVWPGGPDLTWTNLADAGDVVALIKDLRPAFGDQLRSARVHNGSHAHDATAYLTDALCGQAIAAGLA